MHVSISRQAARVAGFLAIAALASGCSSDNLRSDYDPTVNFGDYKTFNFFVDAGPEDTNYQSFFSQYMVAAITHEMESRGYVKSEES